MKVLFTGMSSGHTSQDVHSTNLGFFGVISDVIFNNFIDCEVEWKSPSVTWTLADLEKYDKIFIGVVPPTSLGANKVYGALHLLNLLYDDERLVAVIDNAQLWQFKTSFAAVARDANTLTTKFYAKRGEYALVEDSPELVKSFSDISKKLSDGLWPATTIYPGLPWKTDEQVASILGIRSGISSLNLDSYLVDNTTIPYIGRDPHWIIDNPTTSWAKMVAPTVHLNILNMRDTKKETDLDIYGKLKSSLGAMISPQQRGVGTWWTYKYMQSINAGLPIVTEWRESIELSDSWGLLAYQVEELSELRRMDIAQSQKASYLSAIPSKDKALEDLTKLLTKRDEVTNA